MDEAAQQRSSGIESSGSGGCRGGKPFARVASMPPLLRLVFAAAAFSCSYAFMTEEKARARQQVADLAGTEVRLRLGPLA